MLHLHFRFPTRATTAKMESLMSTVFHTCPVLYCRNALIIPAALQDGFHLQRKCPLEGEKKRVENGKVKY